MKKSIVVLFHIGFWACYIILILIIVGVFYRSGHTVDQQARAVNAIKSVFVFAFFPSFITFYLCYFLVFPKHLQQKKFYRSILFGLLISLCAAIVGYITVKVVPVFAGLFKRNNS